MNISADNTLNYLSYFSPKRAFDFHATCLLRRQFAGNVESYFLGKIRKILSICHLLKGWLGGAKVSFILRHQGAQLILAYSWARPAILVAGKGRGGCFYFFCFFTFIPVPLSSLSFSFISSTISSIFFLPFSGRRHKMTHKG